MNIDTLFIQYLTEVSLEDRTAANFVGWLKSKGYVWIMK